MTLSPYLADVVVEVAFDAGFSTPAADRTWTDISEYVELAEGISIGYGRQDERSQADANTLTLMVDNSDGRFTPLRAASPYFPDVRLYRPIRVTATPPGGTPSVRFVGYVTRWPTEWDGSDAYARSAITASSRLARLGAEDALRSSLEQAILAANPWAYYVLDEAQGSRFASDTSGQNRSALRVIGGNPALVFGGAVGPVSDELQAVQFNGGQRLRGTYRYGTTPPLRSFVCWFNISDLLGSVLSFEPGGFVAVDYLTVTDAVLDVHVSGTTVSVVAPLSQLTQLLVTVNGGALEVYVNGDFTSAAASGVASPLVLTLGNLMTGSLAHVAAFDTTITASQADQWRTIASAGHPFEMSSERLLRYARYVAVPDDEVVVEGLSRYNDDVPTLGQGPVEMMRQLEVTEQAVLHDTRDGNLALRSESVRYTAESAFTLDMAAHNVESDFSLDYDLSSINNDVTVSRRDGLAARLVDEVSRQDHGRSPVTMETTSADDEDAAALVAWHLERYSDPQFRVPTVTVDVAAQTGNTPTPDELLAADIHTLFAVENQPGQAPSPTGLYFVEGYTETFGVASHVLSFNVSPQGLFGRTVLFDDPARGFDSDSVFAF